MIYLDTSVLAAYYCPDEKSDAWAKDIENASLLLMPESMPNSLASYEAAQTTV